jgi:hypothetical protein
MNIQKTKSIAALAIMVATAPGSDFRLCRPMCGKAMPFRQALLNILEAMPPGGGVAAKDFSDSTERLSLSAHLRA